MKTKLKRILCVTLSVLALICTSYVSGSATDVITVTPVIYVSDAEISGCASGESVIDTVMGNLIDHGARAAFVLQLDKLTYNADFVSAIIKFKAGNHLTVRSTGTKEQMDETDLLFRYILGEVPCLVYDRMGTYAGELKKIPEPVPVKTSQDVGDIADAGNSGVFVSVNAEDIKTVLLYMDINNIVCSVLPDADFG